MGAIRFLHLSPPLQAMLDEALAEWELWKRHEPLDLVRTKLARARRRGGYYGAGGLARLRAELREARWKQTLVAAERRAQRPDRTPAERFTWALLVHHRRERDRRIAWEIRHYDALSESILATLRQQKTRDGRLYTGTGLQGLRTKLDSLQARRAEAVAAQEVLLRAWIPTYREWRAMGLAVPLISEDGRALLRR